MILTIDYHLTILISFTFCSNVAIIGGLKTDTVCFRLKSFLEKVLKVDQDISSGGLELKTESARLQFLACGRIFGRRGSIEIRVLSQACLLLRFSRMIDRSFLAFLFFFHLTGRSGLAKPGPEMGVSVRESPERIRRQRFRENCILFISYLVLSMFVSGLRSVRHRKPSSPRFSL